MAKILLVEDDKSLREIYGVRLLAEGYDIISAGDGEEALAMAIKDRPDLIVSDVMMPKISGFDMLDILRSTTETRDIKVIMMTALSSEDQRERGEQLGADRYLVKSQVGIEDVVRTVHEVLGDAPVAAAGNTFATPAPTAVPHPAQPAPQAAAVAAPEPVAAPVPAPVLTTPLSDAPAVQAPVAAPAPAPEPTPLPSPTPTVGTPQQPAPSSLPQPTAPFSTSRPASLGERVIQPIEKPQDAGPQIADLIDQELQGSTSIGSSSSTLAPQPAAPPAAPTAPPAPAPAAPPAAPTPEPAPAPVPVSVPEAPVQPPAQPAPVLESTQLAYEETPNAQAPQQPPAAQ